MILLGNVPCASLPPAVAAGPLLHLLLPSAEGAGGNLSEMCSTHRMGRLEQGDAWIREVFGSFLGVAGGIKMLHSKNVDEELCPAVGTAGCARVILPAGPGVHQGNKSPSLRKECKGSACLLHCL